MKVVGFVPSKLNSQRLPRKNVRLLDGRPLVNYALEALAASQVDESILYASSAEIAEYIEDGIRYRLVLRPAWLDSDDATAQDFIASFLESVHADVVVLHHITSPFIRVETIDRCISAVVSGTFESAFAAVSHHRFAWFNGSPLNYRLDLPTPRTQDLAPVLFEQSGLYVFTRDLFERTRRRISDRPYLHLVDPVEGHDIDTAEEFAIAEAIASQRSRYGR